MLTVAQQTVTGQQLLKQGFTLKEGLAAQILPTKEEMSNTQYRSFVLPSRNAFCSNWKRDRPFASSATSSPSMTQGSLCMAAAHVQWWGSGQSPQCHYREEPSHPTVRGYHLAAAWQVGEGASPSLDEPFM